MSSQEARTLVLTNDDGIDAPGIAALLAATEGLGRRRVIAPFGAYSGCGHVVTTHAPITITRRDEERFAVEGTPADCARLAICYLEPSVDWLISGINAGGNLGTDVFHSGTVAAAREAAIQGKPGIAISHYIARGRAVDWERGAEWARPILKQLMGTPWEPGTFWNVNLPHPLPDLRGRRSCFVMSIPRPCPWRIGSSRLDRSLIIAATISNGSVVRGRTSRFVSGDGSP